MADDYKSLHSLATTTDTTAFKPTRVFYVSLGTNFHLRKDITDLTDHLTRPVGSSGFGREVRRLRKAHAQEPFLTVRKSMPFARKWRVYSGEATRECLAQLHIAFSLHRKIYIFLAPSGTRPRLFLTTKLRRLLGTKHTQFEVDGNLYVWKLSWYKHNVSLVKRTSEGDELVAKYVDIRTSHAGGILLVDDKALDILIAITNCITMMNEKAIRDVYQFRYIWDHTRSPKI